MSRAVACLEPATITAAATSLVAGVGAGMVSGMAAAMFAVPGAVVAVGLAARWQCQCKERRPEKRNHGAALLTCTSTYSFWLCA